MKNQSEAFWKKHVKNFYNGDLSQNEYCRRHRLKVPTFSAYKFKYANEITQDSAPKKNFVPVANEAADTRGPITVSLNGGIILTFDKEPNPSWLGKVLGAINDNPASTV